MLKLFWILSALGAAALTASVVAMNETPEMARERAAAKPVKTAQSASSPVVVEFFTSQGCSSCPPSDRLAARLAREPGIVVIQRPVTYWDRLGWKDTLGQEANTQLQRSYAARKLAGRNGVYTPQAVVAGRTGLVGSSEADLRKRIGEARRTARPVIRLAAKPGGVTEVMVEGAAKGSARVLIIGLDREEAVAVTRGENGGRELRYTNIWRGERQLGTLAGGDASFMIDTADRRIAGADSYAVIIRQGEDGPILAGTLLPLG